MATYDITGRHTSIHRVTDDVSVAHSLVNKLGSTFTAGVIVSVTRGNAIIEHLDADTMVEIKPGETVAVDPTAVVGAVGVGFASREAQIESTTVIPISTEDTTPLRGKDKKDKK
jgi:hypothetical protein